MAKFAGKLGFLIPSETTAGSGIWVNTPVEKSCRGDVLRNTRRWDAGESVNDDLNIDNNFSVVYSAFASANLGYISYLYYMGARWKVVSAEIAYPRINLKVRGLYNGDTPGV